jgi:lipid A disaccharide synthetase
MIKTPFIGLPNLLLQQHLFPELVQHELTDEAIVSHYKKLSLNPHQYQSHIEEMNSAIKGKGFKEAARLLLSL